MNELTFLTAQKLARFIRQHRASSQEVLEAHLSHIATHNPSLNAIITLDEEQASQRAKQADEALARGEIWGPLHGVPVTILADLAAELARSGCRVESRDPAEFYFVQALQVYGELKEAALTVRSSPLHLPRFMWRALSEQIPSSNPTARGLMRGAGANLQRYASALSQRDVFIAKLEHFLTDWDAWLCPVAVLPAYPHLQSRNPIEQLRATVEVDGQKIPYLFATSAYTGLFNLTGNPVVVLPLARTNEGLPIGVQVVGRRWNDMALLAVAEQLARVTGSFRRPPGF